MISLGVALGCAGLGCTRLHSVWLGRVELGCVALTRLLAMACLSVVCLCMAWHDIAWCCLTCHGVAYQGWLWLRRFCPERLLDGEVEAGAAKDYAAMPKTVGVAGTVLVWGSL